MLGDQAIRPFLKLSLAPYRRSAGRYPWSSSCRHCGKMSRFCSLCRSPSTGWTRRSHPISLTGSMPSSCLKRPRYAGMGHPLQTTPRNLDKQPVCIMSVILGSHRCFMLETTVTVVWRVMTSAFSCLTLISSERRMCLADLHVRLARQESFAISSSYLKKTKNSPVARCPVPDSSSSSSQNIQAEIATLESQVDELRKKGIRGAPAVSQDGKASRGSTMLDQLQVSCYTYLGLIFGSGSNQHVTVQ